MTAKKERDERLTVEQKKLMVAFMEENIEFAQNKLTGKEGRKSTQGLWEILTKQLNNTPGPEKSVMKWQKTWTTIKNKIKTKMAERNALRSLNEGKLFVTELEEKILKIIGPDVSYVFDEGLEVIPTVPEIKLKLEDVNPSRRVSTCSNIEEKTPPEIHFVCFDNNNKLVEEISPDVESSFINNTPKHKRRKLNEQSTWKNLEEMNYNIRQLVEEVRESQVQQKRTNELLADIAESLRHLRK